MPRRAATGWRLHRGFVARVAGGGAVAERQLHGLRLRGEREAQGAGCQGQQRAGEGVALHDGVVSGSWKSGVGLAAIGGQWINMPPFTSSVMPVQ